MIGTFPKPAHVYSHHGSDLGSRLNPRASTYGIHSEPASSMHTTYQFRILTTGGPRLRFSSYCFPSGIANVMTDVSAAESTSSPVPCALHERRRLRSSVVAKKSTAMVSIALLGRHSVWILDARMLEISSL